MDDGLAETYGEAFRKRLDRRRRWGSSGLSHLDGGGGGLGGVLKRESSTTGRTEIATRSADAICGATIR